MRGEWAEDALRDLVHITAFVSRENPRAARSFSRALRHSGASLSTFPHRGRLGMAVNTRELLTVPPYILVYAVDESTGLVRILRVWHGARSAAMTRKEQAHERPAEIL